ncbi:MAG: UDP-N-acetylmuramate dehydrogenase [Bacilli bacterium]
MTTWQQQLKIELQERVMLDEPLKKHTTFRIGGPADALVFPTSVADVEKPVSFSETYHLPITVIGRGSNLLIADEGLRGIVIKMDEGMDHLAVNDTLVTVGAGYSVVKLATLLSRQGLSGLEFASGIPGNVGGAIYMNAGAHGSDFSRIVEQVTVLFRDGAIETLSVEEMGYAYRTSVLQKVRPGIVLEATLRLVHGDKETCIKQMQKNKDYRKETQPWNFPCAGSIFRNPLPQYAGAIVEELGLKGHVHGGVKVSEMHGNFIVNHADGTAKDVLELIAYIQKRAFDAYGVELETEVELLETK